MTLPQTIDFDETEYPELAEIFSDIELGIGALIAEMPRLQKRPFRRRRAARPTAAAPMRGRPRREAAA